MRQIEASDHEELFVEHSFPEQLADLGEIRIMSQVGHADSRTTLEIYAQVQKRLSRRQVHRAFDDLLASAGSAAIDVPTDANGRMSQLTSDATPFGDAEEACRSALQAHVVHGLVHGRET